jgi:hypothetical protein
MAPADLEDRAGLEDQADQADPGDQADPRGPVDPAVPAGISAFVRAGAVSCARLEGEL